MYLIVPLDVVHTCTYAVALSKGSFGSLGNLVTSCCVVLQQFSIACCRIACMFYTGLLRDGRDVHPAFLCCLPARTHQQHMGTWMLLYFISLLHWHLARDWFPGPGIEPALSSPVFRCNELQQAPCELWLSRMRRTRISLWSVEPYQP